MRTDLLENLYWRKRNEEERIFSTNISAQDKREVNKMKNTLSDLNNYLFEELERLQDDELDEEKLNMEINRSKAISHVSAQIINNAKLALDAQKHFDEMGRDTDVVTPLLEVNGNGNKVHRGTKRVS